MPGRTMTRSKPPTIAIDAMGGDFGPRVLVPGAIDAARQQSLRLKLVGFAHAVETELARFDTHGLDVEVVHADDVAAMGDKPSHIMRRRKNTSIQVCCNLVKDGEADGVVSAGHTGVALGCGIFTIGRIKGIERPGLAAFLPREKNPVILIDVGANVDSKPRHLVQFAIMGDALARNVLKLTEPKVGILNIGEEQGKGNVQVNEAYPLFEHTDLNFVGNVEGRDLFGGRADVIVCDGFVGNVALKLSEGLGSAFSSILRNELSNGFPSRLGAFMARSGLRRFKKRLDYEEHGGAPLLGLNAPMFIGHGSAGRRSIQMTTLMTATFIGNQANEDIKHGLEINPEITKFQRLRKMLHSSGRGHGNDEDSGEE